MRGKISDQDLTDYALNELEPNERLYVESMLAVSEECRNDVYETMDMAMLMEECFERQDAKAPSVELTSAQRQVLLDVRMPNRFFQRSAAALAAAAAITLAFVSKDAWLPKAPVPRMAHAVTEAGPRLHDGHGRRRAKILSISWPVSAGSPKIPPSGCPLSSPVVRLFSDRRPPSIPKSDRPRWNRRPDSFVVCGVLPLRTPPYLSDAVRRNSCRAAF